MRLLAVLCATLLAFSGLPLSADENAHPIEYLEPKKLKTYGWSKVKPIERKRPLYPPDASYARQEGWVHMGYTITEDGTVTDPVVIASYPGKVFHKVSFRALSQWTYAVPTEDDDYTLPIDHQIVFVFQLKGMEGTRRLFGRKLARLREGIFEGKDLDKVKRELDDVANDAKKEKLNLYELAALEQAHAIYDLTVGDYDAAVTHAERTLRLSATFDDDNIKVTHHLLLTAYFNLQDYKEVIRVYDDWLAIDPSVAEKDFAPAVEKMREDIAQRRDH